MSATGNITNYVDVTGNVLFDNGSLVPEQNLTLSYPDLTGAYVLSELLIDNATGDFSYVLTSPEIAGLYNINSSVYCEDNAETYFASELLTVIGLPYCGDGIVNVASEDCDLTDLDGATCRTQGYSSGTLSCSATCTYDVSLCTRSTGGGGGGGGGGTGGGIAIPIPVTLPEPVEEEPIVVPEPVIINIPEPVVQEIVVPEPEEKTVTEPVGVGKAFNIFDVLGKINWLSILILAGLITLLFFIGSRDKKEKKHAKKDGIGLDDYLAKRSHWR